jgi:hypothetical protein
MNTFANSELAHCQKYRHFFSNVLNGKRNIQIWAVYLKKTKNSYILAYDFSQL